MNIHKLSSRSVRSFTANAEITVKYVSIAMINSIIFEAEEPIKRGIYRVVSKGGDITALYLAELF